MRGLPLIFLLLAAAAASAQSGRVKPEATPTPRPGLLRSPAERPSVDRPRVAAPTPTPDPTPADEIKVESVLVPIPVTVVDANGNEIAGLTRADFDLKIDDKPAAIGELFRSESPVRLVMLLDNSESVSIAKDFEKDAALKFFRRVIRPDKDLVALYSVATAAKLEQPFTSDISSISRAIELFPPPEGATALLDGIVKAADYLGNIAGRRVIVIVSDGDDTYSDATLEEAVRSLTVANTQVFIVKTTDFENYVRTGSRAGNANIRQLTAERRMAEIAAQTGGAVYSPVDQREVDAAFRQISSELSQQYILGYYPENEGAQRGAFRSISVALKNRPGAKIRTRKGYYVPK